MRNRFFLLIAAMVVLLGISYYANPLTQARHTDDPVRELMALTARDHDLAEALKHADSDNDVTDLVKWINRAEPSERQTLATLLIGVLQSPIKPGDHDDVREIDSALAYRYRNRFRAFVNLGTGDEAIDITIANIVAYTLVAGTTHPSTQDINAAKSLVQRLQHAAAETGDEAILDTIGCVLFAAGDFSGARDAFNQALKQAKQGNNHAPRDFQELLKQRLHAASHNVEVTAPGGSGEVQPLPPEPSVANAQVHSPDSNSVQATSSPPASTTLPGQQP